MNNNSRILQFTRSLGPFIFAIFVISVILIRILTIDGIIGHTWDWNFPHFREQFDVQLSNRLFTWNESLTSGRYFPFTIELPFTAMTFLLSKIFPEQISKILPITLVIFSFIFMTLVVKRFTRCAWFLATIGGMIYAFSPIQYSRFVAGHLTILLGFCVLPLFLLFVDKIIRNGHLKGNEFIILSILSPLIAVHFSPSLIAILAAILLLLSYGRWSFRLFQQGYLLILPLFINVYWIIPLVVSFISEKNIYVRVNESITQEVIRRYDYYISISQPLSRLLTNQIPFGLNSEFVYPTEAFNTLFIIISSGFFILALLSVVYYASIKKRNRHVSFFYVLLILGIGISTGNNTIFGWLFYEVLYKYVPPLFAGFSNPLRFGPLIYLSGAVLAVDTLGEFTQTLNARKRIMFYGLLTVSMIIFLYPWLLRPYTKPVKIGESQPLSLKNTIINDDDRTIIAKLAQDPSDYKVMFLPPPSLSWPGETNHSFPWTSPYSPKPVFAQQSDSVLSKNILDDLYGKLGSKHLSTLLGLAAVKYVYNPDYSGYESYHTYIPKTINYKPIVDKKIDNQIGLSKIDSGVSSVDVYENKNFLPRIYIPNQITYVDGQQSAIIDIVNFSDFDPVNAFFLTDIEVKSSVISPDAADKVYSKAIPVSSDITSTLTPNIINPTVRILPDSPFYLYVDWKEKRMIQSAAPDIFATIDADLVLLGKRINELKRMMDEHHNENDIGKRILNRYETILINLFVSLEKLPMNGMKENETRQKISYLLITHIEKLRELLRKYSDTSYRDDMLKLIHAIEYKRSYVNRQIWSDKNEYDRRYFLSIPVEGAYDITFFNNDFSINSLKIDNNSMPILSEPVGTSLISKLELAKGIHKMQVLYNQEPNLIILNASSSAIELPDNSEQTIHFESSTEIQKHCFPIINLIDRYQYRLRFIQQALGDPIRLTLEQENDEFFQGLQKYKVDTYLPQGELWNRNVYDFVPNVNTTQGNVCFTIPSDRQEVGKYQVSEISVTRLPDPSIILSKTNRISEILIPKLTYSKINPTKYRIRIENADKPFFMVFSESYHAQWKVYFGDKGTNFSQSGNEMNKFLDINIFENINKASLSESDHYFVNGFANGWMIHKTGAFDITLEFVPQRYFFVSIIVSVISFVIMSIHLFMFIYKKYKS